MATYIHEKTENGIDAILDYTPLRNDEGELLIVDEYQLHVYTLSKVYVDKVFILEVATILELEFKMAQSRESRMKHKDIISQSDLKSQTFDRWVQEYQNPTNKSNLEIV